MFHKSIHKINIKAVDSIKGTFEADASIFHTSDSYGDIVVPGAFSKTLKEKEGMVPFLDNHRSTPRLGIAEAQETDKGLHFKGHLNLEKQIARDVLSDMKQCKEFGMPYGFSFGYDTIKSDFQGDNRILRELKIWEISTATFPAHKDTDITAIKSKALLDFIEEIKTGRSLKGKNLEIMINASKALQDLIGIAQDEPEDDHSSKGIDPEISQSIDDMCKSMKESMSLI